MNKIKVQFSQLRKTTPKYVQWLLLAAAFIVVLILLTLLLSGDKDTTISDADDTPVEVSVSEESIDWSDTKIGEKKSVTIKVTTNAPARVSVRRSKEVAGFDVKSTCDSIGEITPKISCSIPLEYAPTTPMPTEGVPVFVDWRGANMPESMNTTTKITVVLGATAPVAQEPEKKTEPKKETKPEPVIMPEPEPIRQEIKREIEAIAPAAPLVFEEEEEEYIAPVVKAAAAEPVKETKHVESCSDFAFPGYDSTGNQIGWIRPEHGAYYFHPFSDKECKNPTGVYNPDNGIITSISENGKKIGTDAEHIGYTTITSSGTIPQLSNAPAAKKVNRATQSEVPENSAPMARMSDNWQASGSSIVRQAPPEPVTYGTTDGSVVVATQPYDRTFVLRQYKPIPATIVSDVRADTALEADNMHFPVRATVDRNVYSDNGRTIIIPTGTLLLGFVSGEVPGPYKAIGRMNIKWYQFILPNGVEFNFSGNEPLSADSQGRVGVPGRGSTDYLEQFVMPMLTAIVPAAVNMIAPVADKFVNQIDLDNNTVVQSGTLRSSELAKNEIITAWNQVAQKLMVDMMDNTVPPFTIPAGTRITVYSPTDLMVACTDSTKKCYMNGAANTANNSRANPSWDTYASSDDSWVGQVRSFNSQEYCTQENDLWTAKAECATNSESCGGYAYRTLLLYCQSLNYKAINQAKQEALYQNQQSTSNQNSIASIGGGGSTSSYTQQYNENVLGLKYNDQGTIQNPFQQVEEETQQAIITCEDGLAPDANGCCTGEIYTDMGDQGFNCCPETGGDCFPPIL